MESKVEDLDLLFENFYHYILEKIGTDLDENCLKKLNETYAPNTLRSKTSWIRFDTESMRCSYIFKYSTCFTSVVAQHFQKMANDHPWFHEKMVTGDTLTVCCFGGGPGTEIVAISKVMERLVAERCGNRSFPIVIDAIIVDSDPGWNNTSTEVIHSLPQLVDSCTVLVSLSFLRCDVTEPLTEDVIRVIRRSDIVTMVKFLSAVYGTQYIDGREMIKGIVETMSKDGILFILDSSGFQEFNDIQHHINCIKCMVQFYKSERNRHEVSLLPSFRCFASSGYRIWQSINKVCAWYKTHVVPFEDSALL